MAASLTLAVELQLALHFLPVLTPARWRCRRLQDITQGEMKALGLPEELET